jgi:acyl-CoA synthetase (AMP-forming)/AMP-acid ligase II
MTNESKVYRSLLTPLRFVERNAHVYPDKAAVVHGDKQYTYREFGERVNRLASALRAGGLEHGDRAAFLCPNIPPLLEAHFGVPLAGGVLVAINTRLSPNEVAYILNHSGSKFLFVDTELAATIKPVLDQLETVKTIVNICDAPVGTPLDGTDYEAFLSAGSPEPVPWVLEDEEETISINYTSGTTGRPKGVMYTHRGGYLNALGEAIETTLTPDSVYLWTLPMFHCNGWCFTWGVTAVGGTHVCLRKLEPATVWSLIEKQGVTHFNGAPVVLIALLNHPGRPARLDRPLTITTAGAPPSPTLIGQVEALGAKIIHVYGLTETYGPHTVCEEQPAWNGETVERRARLKARQGVAYLIADDVRVVDPDLRDVPADGQTMGEVLMRGNNVMKGYYNDPDATARAFRGGWFHSGDLAVMHPDGYIELRDRSKDIIISGGENISSIEVEQALYRHPAILEVAVVGIPHEKWGETPKAFVTLREGQQVSEQELIEFCREQIAHYKCPTAIEFTTLPKTSTGKIQKYVLREKEWAGKEKRIQGA